MKFRFIWVGKAKDKNWRTLQDEYLRRLSYFVRCDVVEVRDGDTPDRKRIEGKRILEKVNQSSFVCLFDVRGHSFSSQDLAAKLTTWQDSAHKEITFIVGGANGVSAEVADIADEMLSLSFLTFTHEMARVIMLEQLYRAFTIIKGFPYQK